MNPYAILAFAGVGLVVVVGVVVAGGRALVYRHAERYQQSVAAVLHAAELEQAAEHAAAVQRLIELADAERREHAR